MTGLLPLLLAYTFVQAASPARPTIQGVVRDSRGNAVEGALVAVFPEARLLSPDPPFTMRTDAQGRFSVELKASGPHTVRVEAEGLAPQTLKKVAPGASLTVTLGKGLIIEGVIRDGESRTPIPRARVEALEEGVPHAFTEPDLGRIEAETDDKGYYRLSGLSAGLHFVTASARGFGAASKTGVRPGSRVDLFLFSGASIVGTVHGPDGQPVKRALVRAEPQATAPSFLPTSFVRATDAEGRFELLGLKGGTYSVFARARGFAPGFATEVSVPNEGETEVKIQLKPSGRIVGRIVNAEEKPLRGRVAIQELSGERSSRFLDDLLRAEAAEDGRFTLENVPPGSHVLAVSAPGYTPQRVEAEVPEKTLTADVGDVQVAAGLTIRGTVSDSGGLPVGAAAVFGFWMPNAASPVRTNDQFETLSEADGSFSLGGLEAGEYQISVSAPGYGRAEVPRVEAGTARLAITLKPGGSVQGNVVDESGKPVSSFRASLRPTEERGMFGAGDSVLRADGSFSLEDLSEGTYVLQVEAPGKVTAFVSDVKVLPGAATNVGRVVLRSGGSVRGFVVDPTGLPVSGAAIQLMSPPARVMVTGVASAYSDGQGAFEILGVPDGTITLVATHPSYAAGRTSGLVVDSRQGPTEARIVLTLGGRLEGYIRTRQPSSLAGTTVMVRAESATSVFSDRTMATPNSDGYFLIEAVHAGRAQVILMRNLGGGMTNTSMSTAQRDVVIKEGETTQVEFDLRQILVQGHLAKNGAPASGYAVAFRSDQVTVMTVSSSSLRTPSVSEGPSAPSLLKGMTRDDGSFELLVEGPGKYFVTLSTQDGKSSLPGREVEIPDVEVHMVDLAFSGVRVSGVVREKESETPVPGARITASLKPAEPSPPARSFSSTTSGPDGSFEMELEPGDYQIRAGSEAYVGDPQSVKVGEAGVAGVRLLISPGREIKGRIVDRSGRGVAGVFVGASTLERAVAGSAGATRTLPDGSFVIEGLRPKAHNVLASAADGSFAFRAGVQAGKEDVELRLAPGGRLLLRVKTAEGTPVEGARLRVVSFTGGPVLGPFGMNATSADGEVEVLLPAGTVELEVVKGDLKGRVTVQVPSENSVGAEVVLAKVSS